MLFGKLRGGSAYLMAALPVLIGTTWALPPPPRLSTARRPLADSARADVLARHVARLDRLEQHSSQPGGFTAAATRLAVLLNLIETEQLEARERFPELTTPRLLSAVEQARVRISSEEHRLAFKALEGRGETAREYLQLTSR